MQEHNLFLIFLSLLEENNITYIVTGSVAGIIYGEPRLTHDIDLVMELDIKDTHKIVAAFPAEKFYCPPPKVINLEIRRPFRGHFNLIHHESGFKADIYLTGKDTLHKWAIKNRKRYKLGNCDIWVAPPEYVILRKLEYFKEGKSDKHLTDIKNILEVSGDLIDFIKLQGMIKEHNLDAEWGLIDPC
jgi:hypothetical protein